MHLLFKLGNKKHKEYYIVSFTAVSFILPHKKMMTTNNYPQNNLQQNCKCHVEVPHDKSVYQLVGIFDIV